MLAPYFPLVTIDVHVQLVQAIMVIGTTVATITGLLMPMRAEISVLLLLLLLLHVEPHPGYLRGLRLQGIEVEVAMLVSVQVFVELLVAM
jgi:hypothetical protein